MEFVTLDLLLSPPGMVAAVIVLTQVFKKLFDFLVKNQTKWIVFGFSVLMGVWAAAHQGIFTDPLSSIDSIIIWLVNIAMVWQFAMKSFDKITKNEDPIIHLPDGDQEPELYEEALKVATNLLQDHKNVKLKVDKNNLLSRE